MSTAFHDLTRFASTLMVRGCLMVALGTAALIWLDQMLLNAMMITALLFTISGLYEMVLAVHSRAEVRGWFIALVDGAASIAFALLTVTLTMIPFRATMTLTAAWLLLYASMSGSLAFALWPMRRTRLTLLAWCAVDLLLAGMALSSARWTLYTLLYVGAGYAMVFGVFQWLAGLWLRRTAAPEFAPTTQASWEVVSFK